MPTILHDSCRIVPLPFSKHGSDVMEPTPSAPDQWAKFKSLPIRLQEERFLAALDLLWKAMWDEPHDPADWIAILDPSHSGLFPDPFALAEIPPATPQ